MTLARFLWALLVTVVLCSPALATEGETILYGGAGQGRVTFDGQLHASKGFVCNDCHLSLFATQKQSLITMEDHFEAKSCFACHDTKQVFRDCGSCHRKMSDGPMDVTLAMVARSLQAGPATQQPVAHLAQKLAQAPLTYEGATTIGTRILPEASKLFTAKTGIPFGAIGGAGAGAGFKAVVEGKVVLAGLASDMTPQQKEQVSLSQVIGYDVMGVFVHPNNPVASLTRAELKEIFAGRVTNWKQVGGPDRLITIYSEAVSGGRATVKAFQDMVLGKESYGPMKELDDATDCLDAVGKDEAGIAASSMSFMTPKVVAIKIDGAKPDRAAVQSGAYPLKRPLTLITRQDRGDAKTFLDFMLGKEAQEIVGKNFVPVR